MLAITRELTAAIAHCELTHGTRTAIDVARAQQEHAAYERALETAGCRVRRLSAPEHFPDAVFIEDTAVVFDEIAVVARPGADSRRGETDGVALVLSEYRSLAAIEAPGLLDGGDVLRVGKRVFVGRSARSNDDGIVQLQAIVAPHGYSVEGVDFQGCLHLKSAATLVAPDLALLNPAWVDQRVFRDLAIITVAPSEPHAANALLVGEVVLFPSEHEQTAEALYARGITMIRTPAGEFAKAEGGVTCCCLLVTDDDALQGQRLPLKRVV